LQLFRKLREPRRPPVPPLRLGRIDAQWAQLFAGGFFERQIDDAE
jgi:hypothetical protein